MMARLFLSHAVQNKSVVRRVASRLRALGHHPWVDEDEILVGESIPNAVERGMSSADFVVLCWSQEAASRGWVNAEREATMMAQFGSRRERLLPLRLDNTPMPHLLASLRYVDAFPDDNFNAALARLAKSVDEYERRRNSNGTDAMTDGRSHLDRVRMVQQVDALADVVHARRSLEEALSRAKRLADFLGQRFYSELFGLHLVGRLGFVDKLTDEGPEANREVFLAHIAASEDRATEPLLKYTSDPKKFIARVGSTQMSSHLPSQLQELTSKPELRRTERLISDLNRLDQVVARIWKRLMDFISACDLLV